MSCPPLSRSGHALTLAFGPGCRLGPCTESSADFQRFLLWTALYFIGAVLASRYLRSRRWRGAVLAQRGHRLRGRGALWPALDRRRRARPRCCSPCWQPESSPQYLAIYTSPARPRPPRSPRGMCCGDVRLHLRTDDGMRLLGGGVLMSVLSAAFGIFGLLQAGMLDAANIPEAFVALGAGRHAGHRRGRAEPAADDDSRSGRAPPVALPRAVQAGASACSGWPCCATSFVAIYSLGGRGILCAGPDQPAAGAAAVVGAALLADLDGGRDGDHGHLLQRGHRHGAGRIHRAQAPWWKPRCCCCCCAWWR